MVRSCSASHLLKGFNKETSFTKSMVAQCWQTHTYPFAQAASNFVSYKESILQEILIDNLTLQCRLFLSELLFQAALFVIKEFSVQYIIYLY